MVHYVLHLDVNVPMVGIEEVAVDKHLEPRCDNSVGTIEPMALVLVRCTVDEADMLIGHRSSSPICIRDGYRRM